MGPIDNPSRQRGAALLIVLWTAMLLAVLLTTATELLRADLAAGKADRSVASERGAARNAMAALMLAKQRGREPVEVVVDEGAFRVRQGTPGPVATLNTQSAEQLAVQLGELLDEEQARAAAFLIVDWRDRDDLLSDPTGKVKGTERHAANRPFLTVGEAAALLDLRAAQLTCALSRALGESAPLTQRYPGDTLRMELAAADGEGPVHVLRARYAGGQKGNILISRSLRYGLSEDVCIGAAGAPGRGG